MQAADFRIDSGPDGATLALTGDWTATALGGATARLTRALRGRAPGAIDLRELGRFDTAGAFALLKATGGHVDPADFRDRPEAEQILTLVAGVECQAPPPHRRLDPVQGSLQKIGRGVTDFGAEFYRNLAFNGRLGLVGLRTLVDPRRIRWAAWFSLAERAGLDAIPIVALTTFFIGAVVAFLSADLLMTFGASVFAVELIGIAVLREFSVVIAAVLLAGRSASSFAAEIGAMKMNQEVDAMKVMGVDPFEALVLPRVAALLLMTPLLTFVGDVTGLIGGALVVWAKLDLSPAFFLQRIEENVGGVNFWVGMSKAPVFALIVAAIGCRQGMAVGGDVESLGRRVTSAVVQAIFAIIAVDAVFALIYLEAGI
ncbi:ABC transporter permease [Caulobacter sp. 17J65-9]|uniref:ABC transporter permease n=1 Tax=Caulobacter sp. 17J65-9 TaxID=2709382 RepID=UPI0013C80E13|nr:ABC transporter permease [Caulobacter sp. 17J65-9]NEX94722.1 ABC transporter permease [Caulobacter sp. 17J65-9]